MYNLSVAATYGTEDMLPGKKGGKSCTNTDRPLRKQTNGVFWQENACGSL